MGPGQEQFRALCRKTSCGTRKHGGGCACGSLVKPKRICTCRSVSIWNLLRMHSRRGGRWLELRRAGKDPCASAQQSAEFKNTYTQNTVSHETQSYEVDYSFRSQDFPEALILTGPEHLRITGANGSGKTVLLNAIAHANDPDYRSPVPPAYRVLYRLDNAAYPAAAHHA